MKQKKVLDKIEEAKRFLADAEQEENKARNYNSMHGALQCLAAAYNMLAGMLNDHAGRRELVDLERTNYE